MIKINLVAEGRKPVVARSSKGSALPGENLALYAMLAAIVVCGGVFGVWWWMLSGTVADNKKDIQVAETKVRELEDIIRQVEEFERKEAELELKIDVITNLKKNQRGPVEIMDQVSKALPELLWLDRLSQNGNNVTVTGRAFSMIAVSNFIENIDEVPEFNEPELIDSQKRPNGNVYSFVVNFKKLVTQAEES